MCPYCLIYRSCTNTLGRYLSRYVHTFRGLNGLNGAEFEHVRQRYVFPSRQNDELAPQGHDPSQLSAVASVPWDTRSGISRDRCPCVVYLLLRHQNAHPSVPVLMIMRTYALYSRNRKVPLFLGSIIVVGGCVSLVRPLLIVSLLPIKLLTFPGTSLCSGQSARRCSRYLDQMREAHISTLKGASW